MSEAEQALADLIARHQKEYDLYGGKGLGSSHMIYIDIRAWMKTYFPNELKEVDEREAEED